MAAAVLGAATLLAAWWGPQAALGVAAGGAWNLASLWCLTRLLQAWLGPQPSRARAVGWLLAKFPLLYVLVFGYLARPSASVVGFGIGFSVVLAAVVGGFAAQAARPGTARPS